MIAPVRKFTTGTIDMTKMSDPLVIFASSGEVGGGVVFPEVDDQGAFAERCSWAYGTLLVSAEEAGVQIEEARERFDYLVRAENLGLGIYRGRAIDRRRVAIG